MEAENAGEKSYSLSNAIGSSHRKWTERIRYLYKFMIIVKFNNLRTRDPNSLKQHQESIIHKIILEALMDGHTFHQGEPLPYRDVAQYHREA